MILGGGGGGCYKWILSPLKERCSPQLKMISPTNRAPRSFLQTVISWFCVGLRGMAARVGF
jgi:hypothetical protein